jgi:hypothetical protein
MQYALIVSGIVVNKILWDGIAEWEPPTGARAVLVPDGVPVDIGWICDASDAFAAPSMPPAPPAPPAAVPTSVTMRQARLALLGAGKLDAVDAAIASLPSPQKEQAQIEWDYASAIERTSPFLQSMAQALDLDLDLDDAALDALFTQAATL